MTLERHDLIHIVVGRGLLDQDEAFVLGFTMGTASGLTAVERWLFKRILESYPEPYRIFGKELLAYDLGVEAGRAAQVEKIYEIPLEERKSEKLADLRSEMGIDVPTLQRFFRKEQELVPGTVASCRLSVSETGL